MSDVCPKVCARCNAALEPVQQFAFLVEEAGINEPASNCLAQRLPTANGRPIPVCKACQPNIRKAPRKPARGWSGFGVALGVIAAVWLLDQV
ncbi:MAG: hypothetical protein K8U57_12935 [Planctomycetes bacterium]|nr:hypothetical protein [Planctomycetota bacterium]